MRPALRIIITSLVVCGVAQADAWSPPKSDTEAVSLFALGKERRSSRAVEGSKYRVARAELIVAAAPATVRAALLDHARYGELIPQLAKVKVLKKSGEAAEVFLQLPVMNGAATIWAIQRFDAPVAEGKGEKIVGHFLKGNVDALRSTWSYRGIDASHTILALEMYVEPQLPVAASVVNGEVEGACADGVRSARKHLESKK